MSGDLREWNGAEIREFRVKDLRVTQTEFAALIGYGEYTVYRWEKGSHIPGIRARNQIHQLWLERRQRLHDCPGHSLCKTKVYCD